MITTGKAKLPQSRKKKIQETQDEPTRLLKISN